MNRKLLLSVSAVLVYVLASFLTGCSSSSSKSNNTPSAIAATTGSGQSVTVGTAFTALTATVTNSSGNPVSGASVTFTVVAGSTGASASFATGGTTDTETTGSTGQATTSQALTANTTAGAFTVTASVSGVSTPATFNLTNTAVPTTTYAFYASGTELANTYNSNTESYYAVAGAVTVDNTTGNVVGGEEDYNDGFGITQGGATGALPITGGTLTVSATTGQGTLTLITNNGTGTQYVGVAGTETLGVQFVNANHALIVQFDGSATSSGSLDLQTVTSSPGNFSFLLSGVDYGYNPVGYGGVYSVSSNSISGTADVNDNGTYALGNAFTGSSSSPDSYGRGSATVTINGTALALFYYQVGPEVLRLIDMDNGEAGAGFGNAAIGSAYGQGTTGGTANTFSASSLGTSVFGLQQGDIFGTVYAAVGEFTTNTTALSFSGVSDDNVNYVVGSATVTGGAYTVGSNGYGTFVANAGGLPGIVGMGMYMTDPTLNLLDPNSTSNANNTTAGGLLLALDSSLAGGTGFILPQTDTTTTDFTGNYAFGAQEYFDVEEFDYVGQGSVSSTWALSGTGLLSDPFAGFASPGNEYTTAAFSGTAVPDTTNVGRYTLPLAIAPTTTISDTFNMVIYQGSADQLLWIDADTSVLGFGTLQQQGSLTGLPAARRPAGKAVKHKQ